MYPFKHIVVALDFSELDTFLVTYTLTFAKIVQAQKVILLHIAGKHVNLDEEMEPTKTDSLTKREQLIEDMRALVIQNAEELQQPKIVYRVVNGDPLTELLGASKKQDADLIVVGRKTLAEGSGAFARKLVRRAICSVMIVPVQSIPKFEKALLPIDFSEYSQMAMETAYDLAKATGWRLELNCLNIYTLPNGYLSSGKSTDEFAKIMSENAKKRFKHFMKPFRSNNDLNVTCQYKLDTRNQIDKLIFNIALVEHVDLIVIGSRGRTSIAAAFLGSTTEKMLVHNISVPSLVIKKKEQNLGFFDALLNI